MSLTSYRAAPPRDEGVLFIVKFEIVSLIDVIGRPGSDRLSRVLRHSTIGAEEFNGRVRDGIGFGLLARATRPAKHIEDV